MSALTQRPIFALIMAIKLAGNEVAAEDSDWSPDDSRLAEIARGQPARGKKPAVYHWLAQWSPAGTHVAYLVSSSGEPWSVRVVAADGTDDTLLTGDAGWLSGWVSD